MHKYHPRKKILLTQIWSRTRHVKVLMMVCFRLTTSYSIQLPQSLGPYKHCRKLDFTKTQWNTGPNIRVFKIQATLPLPCVLFRRINILEGLYENNLTQF